MAYYGIIIDMELTTPETVTVKHEILDDATDPDMLVMAESVSFSWILRDEQGDVVTETLGQRRTRLQQRFNAEIDSLIAQLEQAANQFDTLRGQAVGYRYPASG